jgi:hypothetical protein
VPSSPKARLIVFIEIKIKRILLLMVAIPNFFYVLKLGSRK